MLLTEAGSQPEGTAMVFPDYLQFNIGNATGLEDLIYFLCSCEVGELSTKGAKLEGGFAFVCAHKKKDERCGYCGPRLVQAIEDLALNKYQVLPTSHVGGHKYAGNLIVFDGPGTTVDGNWYGYVTPDNVSHVLSGKARWSHLWRGRVGVSKEDALRERKWQVVKTRAPVFVTIGVVTVAAIYLHRRWTQKPSTRN